jgi:putative addiction module component (TIGR02574 family)
MATKLQVPAEFIDAPAHERIEFVQRLWDEIAVNPSTVPIPEHHKRLLDARLEVRSGSTPPETRPWSKVRDEVLADLKRD